MARRRYNAAEALRMIMEMNEGEDVIDDDDFEEYGNANEGDNNADGDQPDQVIQDDIGDNNAGGDQPDQVIQDNEGNIEIFVENESENESSESSDSSDDGNDQLVANGITYRREPFLRRRRNRNIVEAARNIAHPRSPKEAFNLFISEIIIREILRCTNRKVSDVRRSLQNIRNYMSIFSYDEISACIGILLRAGLDRDNMTDVTELWNPKESRPFYRAVISLQRFQFFLRCLRFDNYRNRAQRLLNDRLAAIRSIWDQFVTNLQRPYIPGDTLTIDEQLVSYRGQIPGRTYMPSKPAKYGVKIFWLAEAGTGYALNGLIYPGRQPGQPPHQNLAKDVVIELSSPYNNSGRDIVTDNYFTSHALAVSLLQNRLTLLGTIRSHRREIPGFLKSAQGRPVESSMFIHDHENRIVISSYVPKRNKNVLLLSSSHSGNETVQEMKNKPQMILDYNRGKGGVDQLDENVSEFTCRRKTVRWPLIIFFNMCDVGAYNAFRLMKFDDERIERRTFLKQLSWELSEPHALQRHARNNRLPQESKQAGVLLGFRLPNIIPNLPAMNSVRRCFVCQSNTRSKCDLCTRAICPTHRVKACKCQFC